MLGIAALAQLALAQFPSTGVVPSPPWRRWLAQLYPEAIKNRIPDNDFVRAVIAHMLDEARQLFPDVPPNNEHLLRLIVPEQYLRVSIVEPRKQLPEEIEEDIRRIVADAKARFPELFVAGKQIDEEEIRRIVEDAKRRFPELFRDERIEQHLEVFIQEPQTAEEMEAEVQRAVEDVKRRFPEFFVQPELMDQIPITVILPPEDDDSDIIITLPEEEDAVFIRRMVDGLLSRQSMMVNVPYEGDDDPLELEMILLASIH